MIRWTCITYIERLVNLDKGRNCRGKSYVVTLCSIGSLSPALYSYCSHWVRGVSDSCVRFMWGVYPHATVCTVRTTVCTKCSTTDHCSINESLVDIEVKRKKENWWNKIAGLVAEKYVGHAGISHRGYCGGIHGRLAGDIWCYSCHSLFPQGGNTLILDNAEMQPIKPHFHSW